MIDIRTNAGRCDICGSPIDMEHAGDTLSIYEFGIEDEEFKKQHGLSDQDAANGVADALERVSETAAGRDLARVIRKEQAFAVHNTCLSETNFSMLETEAYDGE